MAIQWSERLSVGSDIIDTQHRELLSRFNDLLEACRLKKGKEKVVELLAYLDSYTVSHFAEEEALMARCGYPGLEEHRLQHREFIARLGRLQADLEREGASLGVVVETNEALLSWILRHIKAEDVLVGAHLLRHG
jgi:hemerythrin